MDTRHDPHEDPIEPGQDQTARGDNEQDRAPGDHIDPDEVRSEHRTGPRDPDSPGATIDDPQPAEPNEPA